MTHIDTEYTHIHTEYHTNTHKYTHSTHIYTQIATSLGGSQKITRIYIYIYIYIQQNHTFIHINHQLNKEQTHRTTTSFKKKFFNQKTKQNEIKSFIHS